MGFIFLFRLRTIVWDDPYLAFHSAHAKLVVVDLSNHDASVVYLKHCLMWTCSLALYVVPHVNKILCM